MLEPLLVSLRIAGLATLLAVVLGIGFAAILTGRKHFLIDLLDVGVNLPLVLPPTVLGYYLLVLLGARSPIGAVLESVGMPLVFTWRGAVTAATLVAIPLVVQSAKASMDAVDSRLKDVARTLGRSDLSIFFTITLPLAWRGVFAGSMLAFARSLGEFGATLLVAGNIPGRTQTLPIAIYDAVQAGEQQFANRLALLLTVAAFGVLLIIQRLRIRTLGSVDGS